MDAAALKSMMDNWAVTAYWRSVEQNVSDMSQNDLDKLERIFTAMGIRNLNMTGNSVVGLKPPDIKTDVLFAKQFDAAYRRYQNDFSPALFLVQIYSQISGLSEIRIGNNLRRALADYFPSGLRELDLESKLLSALPGSSGKRDPVSDVTGHTDILLNYNNNSYRIWSYLSARPKWTILRLKGESRGALPAGIHVLCPMDRFNKELCSDYLGWSLHRPGYVDSLAEMIVSPQRILTYEEILSDIKNKKFDPSKPAVFTVP